MKHKYITPEILTVVPCGNLLEDTMNIYSSKDDNADIEAKFNDMEDQPASDPFDDFTSFRPWSD